VCSYGLLSGLFLAGDIIPFHGQVIIPEEVAEQRISLREAAKNSAAATRFVRSKCNCLRGCQSRRCSCLANNIRCSSHFHPQHSCMNVDVDHLVNSSNFNALLSVSAVTEDDVADVLQGHTLTDNVMCTVSSLLQDHIQASYHDSVQNGEYAVAPVLQILHWNTKQHWITISNIDVRSTGVISVYDSKWYDDDIALQNMLAGFLRCARDKLTVNFMHVQHQSNNTDCLC